MIEEIHFILLVVNGIHIIIHKLCYSIITSIQILVQISICRFFLSTSQCNSMLFYLNTITVMYISLVTGMLYTDIFFMRDGVEHPTSYVEASQKKAKLEALSTNISERRGVPSL